MKNWKYIYLLATILVIAGAMFKIMHWAYGSEIMSLGMLSGFIVLIVENSSLKKELKQRKNLDNGR